MRLDDLDGVRREYADETRLAARAAAWVGASGPDPRQLAFEAAREVRPRRVLEVGCGRGEAAERMVGEVDADVVAVDQSERMVELTQARGVRARVGDVQDLPFADASFDCALAAWMLYHLPDLDRGLAELARVLVPGGRLVAVTNSERNLRELWTLCGLAQDRYHEFSAESGTDALRRYFASVERREARGTLTFPDRAAARRYVTASVTRSHLADRLPPGDGAVACTRFAAVFVATKAA